MQHIVALSKPGVLGSLELKNRIIMAAMTTYSGTEEGSVTERLIHFYQKRARGGVGLVIVQCASVTRETPGAKHMLGIYDDQYISGLKRLAESVHEEGAKIAIQIGHLGPGQGEPMRKAGWTRPLDLIAPSALPYGTTGTLPREMSMENIQYIQNAFVEAAHRGKECGFDAIEVHAAHGRLISMFLSPYYNRRSDSYGGNKTNRARFACELIRQMKERLGAEFPLIFKINGDDLHKGGTSVEEAAYYAKLFEVAGLDALCISAGVFGFSSSIPSHMEPPGPFVPFAERIKRAVGIPIIAVGKIGLPLGEELLQQGKADYVAIGRPLLADPELFVKFCAGRSDDIQNCRYCNQCLVTFLSEEKPSGEGIRCAVNPSLLREGAENDMKI